MQEMAINFLCEEMIWSKRIAEQQLTCITFEVFLGPVECSKWLKKRSTEHLLEKKAGRIQLGSELWQQFWYT